MTKNTLSLAQLAILKLIAAGKYRTMVLDMRSLRVLERNGLVAVDESIIYPHTYVLTEAGAAAVKVQS